LYVVESSVSFDIAVEAALLKIDNLRNLDGVGAITNIISAAMHVRKPLGGSVALSVVERHKFVVANTIDATHYRGTFVDVDVGTALLSIRDNGIYAGDVQVVLGQDLAMAA